MCEVVCQYAFLPSKLLSNVSMLTLQSSSNLCLKSSTFPLTSPHVASLANPSLIFCATSYIVVPCSTSNIEPSFNVNLIIFIPPF